MTMWMTTLTAGLLLLGGCARTTGTETGNPPVIAQKFISVTAVDDASVEVTGTAGAVTPGGGQLRIENARTGDTATVDVAEDGSFTATLHGKPDDAYRLVATLDGKQSDPTVLDPTMTGEDWQALHLCSDSDPMDPIDVTAVALQGDEMVIDVGHSGGCAAHAYGLCYDGEWAESFPIQLGFKVLHDAMGDSCEAYETAELRFDLAPFRQAYADAYRTDSGAAEISLDDCEGDDCTVVYRWNDELLPAPPADWTEIDTPCPLTLMAPDDLEFNEIAGTDSCVFEFFTQNCLVKGDYGAFSDPLTDLGDDEVRAERFATRVDGRPATFVTTVLSVSYLPYFAAIHIPDEQQRSHITLAIECASEDDRDTLLPLLGSVRF